MRRLSLLAVLLILVPFLPVSRVQAASLRSTMTRYGLRLTLTVPATTYARNALIRVSVSLYNGSTKPYTTFPGSCPGSTITAQVINSANVADYPPILQPLGQTRPCTANRVTIAPGHTLTRNLLIILRDDRVRAVAQLTAGKKAADLVTPPVTLHLTSRAKTAIVVAPGNRTATVARPKGAAGKLTYAEYLLCLGGEAKPVQTVFTSNWSQTAGPTLTVPTACGTVEEWDIVAGYQGFPVAQASACAPDAACPYAVTAHETVVTTQNDAVRLTLTLPARTYPQNALVLATVRLENISGHPVWYTDACPGGVLSIQVTDAQGGLYYPPAQPGGPQPKCKRAQSVPLAPGDVIQRGIFAVLRAPNIRALAEIGKTPGSYFETAPVTLQLTAGTPPAVQVHASPAVSATITPPAGSQGPLYVNAWARCGTGAGSAASTSGPVSFTPVYGSTTITPDVQGPCQALEWHALAGWVGQPVATVAYTGP